MIFDRDRFWNNWNILEGPHIEGEHIAVIPTARRIIPKGETLDDLTCLEADILEMLKACNIDREIAGIPFPIDVRVVQPEAPDGYLEKEKAIDHIHCDPWRGEPDDGVNAIYYIEVGEDTPTTELWDVTKTQVDNLHTAVPQDPTWKNFIYEPRPRDLLLFDAYVPHRGKRRGTRNRVSLNFTLRRLDPYRVIDKRWNQPQQNWSKYWYLPDRYIYTFKERLEWEIEEIWKRHPSPNIARRLVELREKYVDELKSKMPTSY